MTARSAQSPASPEDWIRLGKLIKARRDELRLTQQQIQDCGGPSPATMRALEHGRARALSRTCRRGLERALQWQPKQIDSILQGMRRPRLPRSTARNFVTPADGRRWREALQLIAEEGCTQPSRTCCCLVAGLPREDWCSPCIAHHALRPPDSEVPQ